MAEEPAVAVVIPTRNRPQRLARSLERVLAAAAQVGGAVEVVVVDDGGDGGTRAVAEALGGGVRYLRSSGAGPGAARNAGVAASSAPVVAFTDDDTEADPAWLVRALARLDAEPAAAAVEGAVLPSLPESPLDAARARVVDNRSGGAFLTANLVVRRAAFDAAGGFLPLRADAAPRWNVPFREDTDLGLRLERAAGPVVFDPEVVVRHPVDEVDLRGYLRTARYFELDAALQRLHPQALPPLRRPLARARIRSAVLAALAAPGALRAGRARAVAAGALALAVGVQQAQVERDLARAGLRRPRAQVVSDIVRRTPRCAAWALVAGASRVAGVAGVRAGRIPVRTGEAA
ncbi:MAG TPA: glycosyltransferase [Solirubrobacteraceae bacterium]|nr:glycosyltransferase [Solirubrobacteraceae bacterium]